MNDIQLKQGLVMVHNALLSTHPTAEDILVIGDAIKLLRTMLAGLSQTANTTPDTGGDSGDRSEKSV